MRLLILFSLISIQSIAQIGTGQWRLHIASSKALDVVATPEKVFTAFGNGVSEYDLDSKELSTWDVVSGLSDISVSCLVYSSSNNAVFIGYENGNLDKIKDNAVTNIPAIVLAEIQGSKKIYNMVEYDGYVYLATGFAIVKIDPAKNEVRDTYYPTSGNAPIVDVAFRGDSIFALTEDRLYRGYSLDITLANPQSWTVDSRLPIIASDSYTQLEVLNNELLALKVNPAYGQDSVLNIVNSGATSVINESFAMEIQSMNVVGNRLAVNYVDGTMFYTPSFTFDQYIGTYSFGGVVSLNAIAGSDNELWLADRFHGLVHMEASGGFEKLYFSGPPKNQFYKLDWKKGKLAVAGGGISDVFVTFSQSGVYTFEDEEWKLYDKTTLSTWQNSEIWDYIAVSVNPVDHDIIAVGSYSETPLSLINQQNNTVDTLTPFNSNLEFTPVGLWSAVTDLEYDNSGNLWVLNSYTDEPLKAYLKDGSWYNYSIGIAAKSFYGKDLEVDYNGNKWIAFKNGGLYGYNDNDTPSNLNDDAYVRLDVGENTGALPSNNVNTIAVDFDNEIWIGTDNGFAVLYNSDNAFDAAPGDYNAQRIKLEYEGNVEYLLGNTNITDIEVDGGNRKWFGTANSGILLLSADGQEILEQHTVDNSPLISNSILDLELDQNTGELFIVTDQGLISYRTDATYEDSDYSSVTVFPNPARPEFDGPITIQGIQYDSDVKVTDVAGNLVYKTTSNGGTATWDGRTLQGEKVKTGVYLIWTAPNEGKKRFVGKVLIVN